jgi:hypothetical protein
MDNRPWTLMYFNAIYSHNYKPKFDQNKFYPTISAEAV